MGTNIMFILLLFLICGNFSKAFQCIDDDNKPVDWFVVYKIPEMKHANISVKSGTAYVYITSENYKNWSLSKFSINSTTSMIANTLKPLYNNTHNYAHVIYNDQPPNEPSEATKGHNKGVIFANPDGGFWMIHSVPHFPPLESVYSFPKTGIVYGQSFLCISLDLKNVNEVGVQLQYNEPQIYSQEISNSLKDKLPQLATAAAGTTVKTAPWYRQTNITSKGNVNFVSFAKSKNFRKDLYEDWLAPVLKTNLFVETWMNGPGKLPSNCTKPFKVFNVKSITLRTVNVTFTETHDHSKWAVSEVSNDTSWICIGDINRMEHQKLRGGGTTCLRNKILANNYQKLITAVEKCSNN